VYSDNQTARIDYRRHRLVARLGKVGIESEMQGSSEGEC